MDERDGIIVDADGMTEEEFLAAYDITRYPQPSVTVDNVIFTVYDNDLRVLLIKRGGHPYLGRWALPGGFMAIGESTDEAVRREVEEETGIRIGTGDPSDGGSGFFEQLRTFTEVGRDPRGRILSVSHMTLLPAWLVSGMHAGDDANDAAWFSVNAEQDGSITLTQAIDDNVAGQVGQDWVEPKVIAIREGQEPGLAFDHDEILRYAIARLVAKIEYSCIAFSLLANPGEFTITELRHVYEAVTGRRHDAGNFQRMFKKTFIATGLVHEEGFARTEGRPATKYCFDGGRYDRIVK